VAKIIKGVTMLKSSTKKIKQKFKDEWVLLSNFETNEFNEPISGVVIAHSKKRSEIYDRLSELKRRKRLCVLFTGKVPPENVAVMF